MVTARTKIFTTHRGQAVMLPKDVALPDSIKEVDIVVIGNQRMITPVGRSWDAWFDGPTVTDDYMAEREQPNPQEREGV